MTTKLDLKEITQLIKILSLVLLIFLAHLTWFPDEFCFISWLMLVNQQNSYAAKYCLETPFLNVLRLVSVLLYTDDIVLVSDSPSVHFIDALYVYCDL